MSSLNLNHLNTLLGLPCIIDGNKSLLKCPIIASANQVGSSHFTHTVNPKETLPMFLKRVYNDANSYDMDCSIYAQLVSNVLSDRWPTDGGNISLYIADDDGAIPLWDSKIDEMGYIGVSNKELADTLNNLPITFKGQWTIRIRDNEFLGLMVEGPTVMTMQQWVSHLRSKMEAFASERSDMPRFSEFSPTKMALFAGRNLLNIYFMTDRMNKWGFYSRPGFASIKAKWTSEGIVLKHKSIDDELLDSLRTVKLLLKLELLLNSVKRLTDSDDEISTSLVSKEDEPCPHCGKVHPKFNLDFPFSNMGRRKLLDFESLYPSIMKRNEDLHRDFTLNLFSKSFQFQAIARGKRLSSHGVGGERLQLAIVDIPKQVKPTNSQLIEARRQQQYQLKRSNYQNKKQQRNGRPNVFRMNSGR